MAENRDISSGELRNAGDVNIGYVRITSMANNTFFNIKNQVITIQVYEDMFSPFITGSIIIKDSLDLINALPFAGMEFLEMEIFTPTLDTELKEVGIISGKFYIYKITEREYIAEKSLVYQLHFISSEAVQDLNNYTSRAYEGKISDIVGNIITKTPGLDTDKRLVIEPTKNSTKFVSNYWSPIKCINYLQQQAVTPNNSTTYTFFENRTGFNFVSLDYLNDMKPYQEFIYGTTKDDVEKGGGSHRNITRDFKKVLELTVPTGFDYIDRTRSGTYASRMITHDMTTKRYITKNYDYLAKFSEGKETRLNKFPITTEYVVAKVNATIMRHEVANQVFSGYGDVSNYKVVQDRVSRMKQSEAMKLTIRVKGRTDYTVGMKINLTVYTPKPTRDADTPEDIVDKMHSGNYLIAAINHVIDKEQHECFMEIIKDSLIFDLGTGKTS
jgi:hypothetical protein